MNFNVFRMNVLKWATDRGIYQHSTVQAQTLKAVSEMGELADSISKGEDVTDDIGDIIVCLINVAVLSEVNMDDCFEHAWNEIKDRKGKMVPGGTFVKKTPIPPR